MLGFATTFTVITGDNWSDIFYKHFRGVDKIKSGLFFMSLKIIG